VFAYLSISASRRTRVTTPYTLLTTAFIGEMSLSLHHLLLLHPLQRPVHRRLLQTTNMAQILQKHMHWLFILAIVLSLVLCIFHPQSRFKPTVQHHSRRFKVLIGLAEEERFISPTVRFERLDMGIDHFGGGEGEEEVDDDDMHDM